MFCTLKNRNQVVACIVLVIAICICTFVVSYILRPSFRAHPTEEINLESYQRILLGMSFQGVQQLIGEPGVYGSLRKAREAAAFGINVASQPPADGDFAQGKRTFHSRVERWYGEDGAITVAFDHLGIVIWKHFQRLPVR